MHYDICMIGAKDTTVRLMQYLAENVCSVDCVITVNAGAVDIAKISGYSPIAEYASGHGTEVYQASSYSLKDDGARRFFQENTFGLGICMGWQRLIPPEVLERFRGGIFGFHGSCGYLPYGRGRSPLNWSVINGDTRFIVNLFQYDEKADSPNVYQNRMFEITPFDTVRTLQYKNLLVSYELASRLVEDYRQGRIRINRSSKDFDMLYAKRMPQDGKISFFMKTREIYNLVRGVTKPFPGAFANIKGSGGKVIIWDAIPFDEIMDFSKYQPGEVIEVFDGMPLVRTIDGSLLIREYEGGDTLEKDTILL